MNSTLPSVSIITPNFNGMPFLKFTIESIRNQGYSNLEHIVIDAASNDGSVELLKSYSEITWISEKDKGQSHALNKGLALAKGEIIGWLNSDDTYTEGAVSKAVMFLLENPEFDLVGTDVNVIDENDFVIGKAIGRETNIIELLNTNPIKQPTVFIRRAVFEKVKGVLEELHYTMDQELWLRVLMCGFKFKYLPNECFANFRLAKGTKSYESGPNFQLEWHNYILKVLRGSYFEFLSPIQKRKIISKSYMSLYFSKMQLAFSVNDKISAIRYYFKSIRSHPNIIFNLGLTKLLFKGIINRDHNMFIKFKKNGDF